MNHHLFPRPQIIVFDVDGTLVDVRESYRATAPLAGAYYLQLLGLTPPAMTGDVYDQFKLMGGFNDDWDLTAGLLEALVASLPAAHPLPERDWPSQEALVAALRCAASPLAGLAPHLPDWQALIPQVRAAGGGLAGLRQVTGGHNAHLVWHTGDAATTDLVQRIFSEIYLGQELFALGYGYPARYYLGPGMVERERLLISLATLAALSRHAHLGIATGRTRFELTYPLRHLGLERFFAVATTMDDALHARTPGGPSLLKPHPYLLERAADQLDPHRRLVAAYVGDTADDVLAARRANAGRRWLAIAIAAEPGLQQLYRALGADLVLDHPDQLLALLPPSPQDAERGSRL